MSKVTMWRSRWRCVIKPAYSVSFLVSINIFVWQNVLYFPNDFRSFRASVKPKSSRITHRNHCDFYRVYFAHKTAHEWTCVLLRSLLEYCCLLERIYAYSFSISLLQQRWGGEKIFLGGPQVLFENDRFFFWRAGWPTCCSGGKWPCCSRQKDDA